MKKTIVLLFSLLFVLFFVGCKNNAGEETAKTSKVLLECTAPGSVSYTFIDQEGEIYKTGTVYNGETITINHFLNGVYNVHSFQSRYETSVSHKKTEISDDCTITFGNYGGFTITK